MNYESGAKILLWQPAVALLSEHRGLMRSMVRRDLSKWRRWFAAIAEYCWRGERLIGAG